MVSVALMTVWGVLDFLLLAAGGLTIAFSFIWRSFDPFRNMVISQNDLTFGLVLGIFYGLTFVVSVGAIIQQNHITVGLVVLNWLLLLDTILTVVYGCILWFPTLQEQNNFRKSWLAARPEVRVAIQDMFVCCGYGPGQNIELGGQVCPTVDAATALGKDCMTDRFLPAADAFLMNAFTVVWSFTAILVMLFIATLCVMKKREEQERFRKIDAKRGGRGFV